MKFGAEYLNRLSRLETPDSIDQGDDEECNYYCQIRNYAKDLLRNPSDVEVRERLSELIKILETKLN